MPSPRALPFLGAIVLLSSCRPGAADTPAALPEAAPTAAEVREVRGKLEGLLGGEEDVPTQKEIVRHGRPAFDALAEIFADRTVDPVARNRAVSVMGFLEDPRATQWLLALSMSKDAERIDRRSALIALGNLRREALVGPIVEGCLSDASTDVRDAAVRALVAIGGPGAHAALVGRARAETDPAVRLKIDRHLSR
jgi:HEAT repeat protein